MKQLIELEGIGPKNSLLFEKLGIYTIDDLITFYPKRYDVLKKTNMDFVSNKDRVVIDGIVEGQPTVIQVSSKLKKIIFRITDNRGIYNIVLYNQVYLLRELKYGMSVIVIGKYDKIRNNIVASEVRFGKLPKIPRIEAIYSSTEGLNRKIISKVIDTALRSNIDVIDYVPKYLVNKYNFMDKLSAIKEMHHPNDAITFKKAKQRLKYEEFFWYLLRIRNLKSSFIDNYNNFGKNFDDNKIYEFINNLKFELTSDQIKTVNEIKDDIKVNKQMNRLIQGDVGSGKTIVAFIAAYMNYLAGFQSALMVPTEVLAVQHYENAIDLFNAINIKVVLLTSNLTKKKKSETLKLISGGKADIIIGTQSLIQKEVCYKRLGLIIFDEQHRFGVNQRKLLIDKGISPDILSMSATPIPRTYALTIYGDMDISSIKTKPKGRKKVSTIIKNEKEIMDVLKLIKTEVDNGHQIYVIAPAIESDNEIDLDNVIKLKEKMELAFGKICKIGCIHGKIDSEEKAKIMKDFEDGKTKILISTTVIEVGVNVPNASMIVIFQANLFGLSTLHQLRGRVGRGDIQSYCILISKEECDRLRIMEKTDDGFEISEYDFKNRGEGDLFGVRQSGIASFKLADIKLDFELLVRVKKDVDEFFDKYFKNIEYKNFQEYLNNDDNLN